MISLSLREELEHRGISRRDFLGFCASMASVLGLPGATAAIAEAVENEPRPILVWLEYQDCAGNTEALLRSAHPTVGEIVLDLLSVNYHETLMAPSGAAAEKSVSDTIKQYPGKDLAIIEGSVPLNEGGIYCTIGGRACTAWFALTYLLGFKHARRGPRKQAPHGQKEARFPHPSRHRPSTGGTFRGYAGRLNRDSSVDQG